MTGTVGTTVVDGLHWVRIIRYMRDLSRYLCVLVGVVWKGVEARVVWVLGVTFYWMHDAAFWTVDNLGR